MSLKPNVGDVRDLLSQTITVACVSARDGDMRALLTQLDSNFGLCQCQGWRLLTYVDSNCGPSDC